MFLTLNVLIGFVTFTCNQNDIVYTSMRHSVFNGRLAISINSFSMRHCR